MKKLRSSLCTYLFRLKLLVNQVEYGRGIQAVNAIPVFLVFLGNRNVRIGNNVKFSSYNNTSWNSKCHITVGKNARLSIDDNAGINGSFVYCMNSIHIGKYVHVGGGCRIYDTNFHNLDWQARRNPQLNKEAATAPVRIEDDVFIGSNCTICKGVTIGARSIVAAGSVVVKSIPEDEMWGGNPAKFIKKING